MRMSPTPTGALAEALYESLLPMLPGVSVEVVAEVDSTNTRLLERVKSGDTSPALMLALRQTAGRGRLARAWHGDEGVSLMVSLGTMLAPNNWSGLSLAVGVAVADALHPHVRLKWPNDLWLGDGAQGRKLGGILIETTAPAKPCTSGARWCVVGVGLNLQNRPEPDLRTPSAALCELMPGVDVGSAAQRVVPALARALTGFERCGFAPLQARFNALDALLGCPVGLSDASFGVAKGVDASGALVVHTERGVRHVGSDEVSVKPTFDISSPPLNSIQNR